MSRIDSLHIHNFKFFNDQKPINLGGKHLLLFGENGSGKSSIYWALYTLFEASVKYDLEGVEKYFKHADEHNESLINIYATRITEAGIRDHYDSFIKIATTDQPPVNFEVSLLNTSISGNTGAVEVNQASDFINYKVLYKFQDFWNGQPMDLAKIFEGYILPYVKFISANIFRDGIEQPRNSAIEMLEEIKTGPGTTKNHKGNTIQVYKYSKENQLFIKFVKHFNDQFKDLIDFINANAPTMLKKLGYDIDFVLKYHDVTFRKADTQYYFNPFKIEFLITSYLGKKVNIHRPQSFLNEAKITAIAIAIRLTVLRRRANEQLPDVLKFIVFDDVMISLDMNNRDKLIDFILNKENKFKEDYQLIFLTHDKNLYDFVSYKIKQFDKLDNWVFKEMYAGKDEATKKEFPIIIDSELESIDKAIKYFEAKDYTACAIYLRKEIEKIVNQRLPPELKYKSDGTFLSLQTLWGHLLERYSALKHPISDDIKDCFAQTKLIVLNPQAHYQQLSMPIYKIELEKAFALIENIKTNYSIPQQIFLLSKGMLLKFKHPTENYTFDFELLSDFYIDSLNGKSDIKQPKCKIITWQSDNIEFHCPGLKKTLNQAEIEFAIKKDDKLNKLKENLKKDTVLLITDEIFIDNTIISHSIWTLKDILDKAGITI